MNANALTVIHKFIRRELFTVADRFACAGPDDLAALRAAIDATAELLHGHAHHEELQFEPLLREMNARDAERLVHDHHELHADMDRIRAEVHALDPADAAACVAALLRLHLDWNRFMANYLLHLDEEERSLFVPLGEAVPPIGFIAKATAEQEPEQGEAFLKKLYAIITPGERAAIEQARENP